MKYAKKIKKHFEFITNKNYLQDCASNLSTLKCASALMEGLCCHLFTGESPLARINELKKTLFSLIDKNLVIQTEDEINLYSYYLSALCTYAKTTGKGDANATIERVASPLFNALFDNFKNLKSQPSIAPAKSLCAINALSDYLSVNVETDVLNLLKTIVTNLKLIDFSNTHDNCFDYLTMLVGALKYSAMSKDYAVNEHIALLFDNFMLKAQSLNYSSAISFENKKETSAHATARSLEVALYLYNNLADSRYLTMARRIWFNGMQFCQRENGQVGNDIFTCESTPRLKVSKYEVKQVSTPLYAIGLKCFATNKDLFNEEGQLFKDRRGRYFIGDKMFARDQSGFFGSDLIEIPTLTAFDRETALQLDFKITF